MLSMSSELSLCSMAKKLVEKVLINGNLLVREGTFFCKNIEMYKTIEDADKIIDGELLKDGVFETSENYGSPFIDYYVNGGISMHGGNIIISPDKNSETLLYIVLNQIEEIRDLLNITIPNTQLLPTFYREQYLATISVLEYFLYCLVLRELIFDREKLLENIRTFDYDKDILEIKEHLSKSDYELFLEIAKVATKTIYHQFVKVEVLYKIIFRQDISLFLQDVKHIMNKRHNIVHRNGRNLKGEIESINKLEVENFICKVEGIVKDIWSLIKVE